MQQHNPKTVQNLIHSGSLLGACLPYRTENGQRHIKTNSRTDKRGASASFQHLMLCLGFFESLGLV